MKKMRWFSSKIRFVCMIEARGGIRYQDSIYLFQAVDFDRAFQVAMQIARTKEQNYGNDENRDVQWRAKEIISLDQLGVTLEGAVEAYSEPVALENGVVIPYGTQFRLDDSRPTQTV